MVICQRSLLSSTTHQTHHFKVMAFTSTSSILSPRRSCKCLLLNNYHSRSSERYFFQKKPNNIPFRSVTLRKKSYNVNRYDRFRQALSSTNLINTDESDSDNVHPLDTTTLINVGKRSMEVISPNRRSFNRTWKRMEPMIKLILSSHCIDNKEQNLDDHSINDASEKTIQSDRRRISSIADVGCDHGMLSLSLACMSWAVSQRGVENKENVCLLNANTCTFFTPQIIGIDLSPLALKNGGLVSLRKVSDAMLPLSSDAQLPIEFRVGNGLNALKPGEADAITLLGMGATTMLEILFGLSKNNEFPVDRVQAQRIYVQPTNSRPQNMMILYDRIQSSGEWSLRGETLTYLGGRWYINAAFERYRNQGTFDTGHSFRYPGHFLVRSTSEDELDMYDSYVKHHLQWLKRDNENPKCLLEDQDKRWINHILCADENFKWKNLAVWFSSD